MNVSLYQAASALSANARWQEVISQNLASASVPGFKKQELSFAAVAAGTMGTQNGTAQATLTKVNTSTNFSQGEIRHTGVSTDVAIDGDGFFEVEQSTGAPAYTRDGEFQINSSGQLVTKSGLLVSGDSGPIQIDSKNPAPLSISSTGEISQGSESKGKLKVVGFSEPRLLKQISGGMFVADSPNVHVTEVDKPSVRQGFLEGSNTSSVMEMANLIRVMRGFEAGQKLVQIQDERMGKAISELGNPT